MSNRRRTLLALLAVASLAGCVEGRPPIKPDASGVRYDIGDTPRYDSISWLGDGAPRGDVQRPTSDGADAFAAPDGQAQTGSWHQANREDCPTFCKGLGAQNIAGPEGAHCMSGERRSRSGIAAGITFPYGCWPSCAPMGNHDAQSVGQRCYGKGQTRDNDKTDDTVGCFCR